MSFVQGKTQVLDVQTLLFLENMTDLITRFPNALTENAPIIANYPFATKAINGL
ncbi:hypothetical protein APHMUC_1451 [Anaplasma phagocytophilum str. ApMUC09]|uniref:Uncharacterized protein n=1 Tax=Anaplasma phagocytophilum str. ApMUC09 TaxID=1359152 RepID=A0A0F3NB47_ANAPH|nr:hypothetical protein APHMUC_1451 [Anaplasma phagocytophilum str. ApMUC09]